MTDYRDEHEAYSVTPPPAVAEFQRRIAELLAKAESKVLKAVKAAEQSEKLLMATIDAAVDDMDRLAIEIKRLTVERDEARREVCRIQEQVPIKEMDKATTLAEDYAEERGWDCFKEDGK